MNREDDREGKYFLRGREEDCWRRKRRKMCAEEKKSGERKGGKYLEKANIWCEEEE